MGARKVRVMRRTTFTLAVAAAMVVSFGVAGTAFATHDSEYTTENPWTAEGNILVAPPATVPTEPCNPDSGPTTGNGVFGEVYALPDPGDTGTGDGDHWFHFAVTDAAGADLIWYQSDSSGCNSLGTDPSGQTTLCCHTLDTRAQTFTVDYQASIPLGATHVVVDFGGGFGSGPGAYKLTLPVESPGSCDQSPFC